MLELPRRPNLIFLFQPAARNDAKMEADRNGGYLPVSNLGMRMSGDPTTHRYPAWYQSWTLKHSVTVALAPVFPTSVATTFQFVYPGENSRESIIILSDTKCLFAAGTVKRYTGDIAWYIIPWEHRNAHWYHHLRPTNCTLMYEVSTMARVSVAKDIRLMQRQARRHD